VFAVLAGLGEGRAGAMRLNALRREVDPHRVRIRIGSFDSPLRARFRHLHIFDYAPARVVEAAEKCAGAEQTS